MSYKSFYWTKDSKAECSVHVYESNNIVWDTFEFLNAMFSKNVIAIRTTYTNYISVDRIAYTYTDSLDNEESIDRRIDLTIPKWLIVYD